MSMGILPTAICRALSAVSAVGPQGRPSGLFGFGGVTVTVPTQGGTVTVTPPNPNNPEGRPCGPTALTALKALQMAVGKIPMDMAYDVTRDGTVNSADARELLRLSTQEVYVLSLIH